MPIPAGTGIDRRRFLLGAAGRPALGVRRAAARVGRPALGDGIAQAAGVQSPSSPVLVSIFLAGGIDALSLLAPAGDPLYRKLRPTLAVSPRTGAPFTEDPSAALASRRGGVRQAPRRGQGHDVPGDRLHEPRHVPFHLAPLLGGRRDRDAGRDTGWLGRYLDVAGSPTNPLQGLSMDGQMNPTLATARNPVAAIDRPEDFSLWLDGVWGDVFTWTLDSASSLGQAQRRSADHAVAQVAQAASEVGDRPPRARPVPRLQRQCRLPQPGPLPEVLATPISRSGWRASRP